MGRCQGGFCTPLVMELINQYKKIDMDSITKKGGTSNIVMKETKSKQDHCRDGDRDGSI
jgi:glycerol-3-phosphate dehydrogenase